MVPVLVAATACALMLAAWLHYLWLIPQERVPERPVMHLSAMALAILGALLTPVLSVQMASEWTVVEAALELMAIGGASFFFYLMTQAPMPDGARTFNVGDPLPAFATQNHDGQQVRLEDFRGKRVLIKFYRGYW